MAKPSKRHLDETAKIAKNGGVRLTKAYKYQVLLCQHLVFGATFGNFHVLQGCGQARPDHRPESRRGQQRLHHRLVKSGGPNPLSLGIAGKSRKRDWSGAKFSHKNLIRLQCSMNVSENMMLKFGTAVRTVFVKNLVEKHLAGALTGRNRFLSELHEIDTVTVTNKRSGKESVVGVFCNDVKVLVTTLIGLREINPDTCDVQVGADSGQS